MCGITGFYSPSMAGNHRALHDIGKAMHEAIIHRGPDDHDVWQDPEDPLVLAHRRLSIIDLSAAGHQPMASPSDRYMITYVGEIYNYLDIQSDLLEAGYSFRGRSDTEVMLTAFDHWGVNQTLQKINGMFAFALWDRKEKKLHLVRDRFGKKPLYVGWAGQTLLFGCELKSFWHHPDFKPEISRDALCNYMRYACVCAPYAIFEQTWQLLPGTRITLNLKAMTPGEDLSKKMEPYWNAPRIIEHAMAHPSQYSEADIIDDFEQKLKKAVEQRMMSDVPLGAFLSGGIDSSTIVAMMQKNSSRAIKTFAIGFKEQAFNEAEHAKNIAQHLNTDHQEFYVSPKEARDIIPSLPDIYDEPFADSSQIPTHLVCQLASDHVTVILTGDGGDELLAGYERHFVVPRAWKKIDWMPHWLRQMGGQFLQALPTEFLDRLRPSYPQFGRRIHKMAGLASLNNHEEIYSYLVRCWGEPETLVTDGKEPLIPLLDPVWQPKDLNFAQRMIYGDLLSYRPNDLMVKIDRAAMAVSLEARAPLMDYELTEYCWTLPHNMMIRNGQGKWLLRQVLKRYVPEELYERPKMGFGVPIGQWLSGPLKEWADDLLSYDQLKAQGYLNADLVSQIWQDHKEGRPYGHNATPIWSVLMFQSWLQRWMKG